MESQVKYHCQLCQEETDHITSHCPKLKCIQCGLQGHAKRDCPLQRGFELKSTIVKEVPNFPIKVNFDHNSISSNKATTSANTSKNGVIHNYDTKTCRGMIKDASSNLMTFNEKDGCHVKGDQVSYDLINGIVYNVTKIESQVAKKRKLKKTKKDKAAKKSRKIEKKKSVTKCLCMLDIQTISIHGHDPQISQIGAIILNDENEVATFNRSTISPDMTELPDRILSDFNVNIRESISESSALNQFVDTLKSHTKSHPVSLMVVDAETVIPTFLRRLEAYNLHQSLWKFHWKCDLKSIMKSKVGLTHLQSFCWGKFFHVYEHVCQEDFGLSKRNMSAEKSAGLLWYVTEKIFNGQDLQQCDEFNALFTKFKSLKSVKSSPPPPSLPFSKDFVSYQNCVYEKSFKYFS